MQAPSNQTIDYLKQLISFDTVSCNSNLQLIHWAEELLQKAGGKLLFAYNAEKTKANLFASFGEGTGGIVLSGHTDVVPVSGQNWTHPPFQAHIHDNRLYGRGACDMKGFIAVVLSHLDAIKTKRFREPLHIALTYDEEVGCLGVPGLLQKLKEAGIHPKGCIIGEPTNMQVIISHKGGRFYRCRVKGCDAHSSLTPQGVNAVEYAARIISYIQDLAAHEELKGQKIAGFDVPFSTLSTNIVHGGIAGNTIPASCEFCFDYRFLPTISPTHFIDTIVKYAQDQVLPQMKEKNESSSISFDFLGGIPALDTQESSEFCRWAMSLTGNPNPGKVSYGTEASLYQEDGMPSIVCGPGSIEQAHKADEYVTFEQIALCEKFVLGVLDHLSS